ncbi:hypothetical protein SCHPADRAFT_995756 [Schizopora paradoxa]|uniref:WD40 repeat-like protein n=1 Tax=Schizopora paradoxa TaxID=27342 RepID=A0A0H2RVJ2_9AGAM|nr:hypothetical protein SCHPADRAFT_995756 [Schizopora paradoxa]
MLAESNDFEAGGSGSRMFGDEPQLHRSIESSNCMSEAATDDEQIRDHGVWSLLSDPRWKERFQAELQERINSASATKEKDTVGAKQLNDFTEQTVALEHRFRKVNRTVLRIFPYSTISHSTRFFRDVLLTLLLRFTESGNALFSDTIPYPFTNAFFEDLLRNINAKGKGVSLIGNSSPSPSQYPPSDVTSKTVLELLGLLASSLDGISSDFEKIMDYVRVTSSEEVTSVLDSFLVFEENLKYWVKSSEATGGTNLSPIYQHNLMLEIGVHLSDISENLDKLIETGLPKLEDDFKEAQKVEQTESLALLSTSAFFSSVTATTLGFSFSQTSGVYNFVNFFWFCSLVFSVASVVNSLLAYSWKHSLYRKRPTIDQLPWFISLWRERTPLYFLVISAMSFSVGLCLFAYASGQSKTTSAVTTSLTGLSALGIAGATVWFIPEFHAIDRLWVKASEEYSFSLKSILPSNFHDTKNDIQSKLGQKLPWVLSTYRKAKRGFNVLFSHFHSVFQSVETKLASTVAWILVLGNRFHHLLSRRDPVNFTGPDWDALGRGQPTLSDIANGISIQAPFTNVGINMQAEISMKSLQSPAPALETTSQESPVDELINALKTIRPKYIEDITQNIDCTSFSPDGKFLAVCNSFVCKLYSTRSFRCLTTIEDRAEEDEKFSVPGSIVWSPGSTQFIITTRIGVLLYEISILNPDNPLDLEIEVNLLRTINCGFDGMFGISIAWLPHEGAFATVNNFTVKTFSVASGGQPTGAGTLSLRSEFQAGEIEEIQVRDVLYIGGKAHLIIAATLFISVGGVKAYGGKLKPQPQIIVYDLERHTVETRIPLFDHFRGLDLSRDHSSLLVAYANKPPQLWTIDVFFKESNGCSMLHLSPQFNFESKSPSFEDALCRGRAFFFGKKDELVVCWDFYHDDFHVFDRHSAVPLYVFTNWQRGGSIRSVDVNRTHRALMFATGSFSGDLTVWTTEEDESINARHES